MSTENGILGPQALPSQGSPESSIKHSSNGSAVSLPAIPEVSEDIETRDTYGGILKSCYCAGCAVLAALGGFSLGYDQGCMLVTLGTSQFVNAFPESEHKLWRVLFTAVLQLGALLGGFGTGWIADKFSRKRSIIATICIFIIGITVETTSDKYAMLVLGRSVSGISIGMLSAIAPVYISEISPAEIRGSLLVLEEVSIVAGVVVGFWISFGTRYFPGNGAWRLPFILRLVPALAVAFGAMIVPPSPRWLASRFENQPALCYLAQLRQLSPDDCKVQNEWMEIRVEVVYLREIREAQHPTLQRRSRLNRFKLEIASWLDCFESRYWKRTQIGVLLMLFQQFVGVNAVIHYLPTLFKGLGLKQDMELAMSGVSYGIQLLGVISNLWTIDKVGRKRLLVYGSSLMLICLVVTAGLTSQFSSDWSSCRDAGWICVGFLFIYMLAFGASWGPIAWAVPSEVFPNYLRAKGVAFSTCSYWLNNFIVGLISPILFRKSEWATLSFFAFFCLLSGFYAAQFVPETKDKTLEDMDKLFSNSADYDQARERKKEIRKKLANSYAPTPFISQGGTLNNGFRVVG